VRRTHKIEFAEQIHKFREHVSRNLYKGRKNVPARRGFSSEFDRKRGFDREAARKTLVFRQPPVISFEITGFSYFPILLKVFVPICKGQYTDTAAVSAYEPNI
jgi:hypothetical protein